MRQFVRLVVCRLTRAVQVISACVEQTRCGVTLILLIVPRQLANQPSHSNHLPSYHPLPNPYDRCITVAIVLKCDISAEVGPVSAGMSRNSASGCDFPAEIAFLPPEYHKEWAQNVTFRRRSGKFPPEYHRILPLSVIFRRRLG